MAEHHRLTTPIFIERANIVHNNAYDYSETKYVAQHSPVTIICPKHGPFNMRPVNHVAGRQGCPLCGSGKKRTTADFITLAKEVHGDRYDYSLVTYKSAITKVKIICPIHGAFNQTPDMHCFSARQGCPSCKASTGERKIYTTLKDIGITDFICEHTFVGLKNPKTNRPLHYDFFIPELNVLIEYDGQQHHKCVNFSGNLTTKEMNSRLKQAKYLDALKSQYANANGYTLIRIIHTDFDKIERILREQLF